jgi:outer membrane protein assembly factor BamE
MRFYIGLIIIAASLIQAACSLPKLHMPRLHRVTVQQGNVITQRMIDDLKPGLTRSQVVFILGEPIYRNTFEDDRWDYLYSIELPRVYREVKRLTVYFENDVVTHYDGDYAPTSITEPDVPPEAIEDMDRDGDRG